MLAQDSPGWFDFRRRGPVSAGEVQEPPFPEWAPQVDPVDWDMSSGWAGGHIPTAAPGRWKRSPVITTHGLFK